MPALTYTVVQIDQDRWGTLQSVQSNLDANATKQLAAAPDPLTDPTIANRDDAYRFEQ